MSLFLPFRSGVPKKAHGHVHSMHVSGRGKSMDRNDEVVQAFKQMARISQAGNRQRLHSKESHRRSIKQHSNLTWKTCSKIALQNVESTTSFRLANIINCCKKGGYIDESLFNALFTRAMDFDLGLMNDFSSIEVSMTVQSLGMLTRDLRRASLHSLSNGPHRSQRVEVFSASCRAFIRALLATCAARDLFSHERFDVRELSSTVHGLGLVEEDTNDPDLKKCIDTIVAEFAIKASTGDCGDKDYSQILHGCANLGYRDEMRMLEICELLKWSLSSRVNFENKNLGTISWALGKLGVKDYDLLEMLSIQLVDRIDAISMRGVSNVIYAFGLSGFRNQTVIDALGKEITKEARLAQCNPQDLANSMYGFELLGLDDKSIFLALGREIKKRLASREFSSHALATIVHALGKSKSIDIDVLRGILDECEHRLKEFTPHSMAMVCHGLALMGEDCVGHMQERTCHFLEALSLEMKRRKLMGFNPQDVSTIFWSFGQLGFYDLTLNASLIEKFLALVREGEQCRAEGMGMILSACASLDFESEKYFDFTTRCSSKMANQLSDACQMSNEMWGRAVCGFLSASTFNWLCQEISRVRLLGNRPLTSQDYQRIVQSWLALKLINHESVSFASLSLLEEAKSHVKCNMQISKSRFEKDVAKVLRTAGIKFRSGVGVLDGLISVDIFVPGDPGLVIECDGPSHYTINKPGGGARQRGSTTFRNRILEASGFKVLCVPYFLGKDEQTRLILKVLSENGMF